MTDWDVKGAESSQRTREVRESEITPKFLLQIKLCSIKISYSTEFKRTMEKKRPEPSIEQVRDFVGMQ